MLYEKVSRMNIMREFVGRIREIKELNLFLMNKCDFNG